MGRSHQFNRDIHGVLLLDKPRGLSSNDVLRRVKHVYSINRAGYTGILDPLATGMLPICFGEATKFSRYLLDADKRYRVVAKLGQKTDTLDADGKIIQERSVNFSKKNLDTVIKSFCGNINQIPPMYSALKYQGKRLYEYARQKIEISRKPRRITIYDFSFISYNNMELELEIYCSKGTYVRSIIDDLGEKLGCGAHVVCLRRLTVGGYSVDHMITMEQLYQLIKQAKKQKIVKFELIDSLLMPIDSSVYNYPNVNLPLVSSVYFRHGNPVSVHETNISVTGLVRVTESETGKFIGMGEIDNKGRVAPRRLIIKYPT